MSRSHLTEIENLTYQKNHRFDIDPTQKLNRKQRRDLAKIMRAKELKRTGTYLRVKTTDTFSK